MIGFYGSTATLPIETKSPPEAVATYTSCGRPDALYAGDAPAHRSEPDAAYGTGSNSAAFRPAPDRARENAAHQRGEAGLRPMPLGLQRGGLAARRISAGLAWFPIPPPVRNPIS